MIKCETPPNFIELSGCSLSYTTSQYRQTNIPELPLQRSPALSQISSTSSTQILPTKSEEMSPYQLKRERSLTPPLLVSPTVSIAESIYWYQTVKRAFDNFGSIFTLSYVFTAQYDLQEPIKTKKTYRL